MSEYGLPELCERDWKISKVKTLLEMCPETNIHFDNDLAFITACKKGNMQIVAFLLKYTNSLAGDAGDAGDYTRECSHIKMIERGISVSIANNTEDMFKYLETYLETYLEKIASSTSSTSSIDSIHIININWSNIIKVEFMPTSHFCIPLLSYLLKKIGNQYFTYDIMSHILITACRNGYIDIIKWVLSNNQNSDGHQIVDLSEKQYQYLRITFNKYEESIKNVLLNASLPINPCDIKYLFTWCCISQYGSLDIARKLYELALENGINLDISGNSYKLFKAICKQDKAELAEWIYSLENIPLNIIRENDDILFKSFSGKYNHNIAEWFTTLCDNYEVRDVDEWVGPYYIQCIVHDSA